MQNLAEKLIANKDKKRSSNDSVVPTVEELPELILANHPAIYTYRGTLYHEHTPIQYRDINKIYQLVDRHDIRLNPPKAIWIYNRLVEIAPPLENRYILVSSQYVWDKDYATLIPVSEFPYLTTQSDATTKRLQQQLQQQGGEDGRMGQDLLAQTYAKPEPGGNPFSDKTLC